MPVFMAACFPSFARSLGIPPVMSARAREDLALATPGVRAPSRSRVALTPGHLL